MHYDFIQIGAHTGATVNDPLWNKVRQGNSRGILVEPVAHLFRKLVANYAGRENLDFENVAVAETPGPRTLYRVRDDWVPPHLLWFADQLASFSRDVILSSSLIPAEAIVEETVVCMTPSQLLHKHGVTSLSLLAIDTEGYDYEILKAWPFQHVKPRQIIYEHKHLREPDKDACRALVESEGYAVRFRNQDDMLAQLTQNGQSGR